ncbi:MAG: hypothetical protein PHI32_07075 [Dysgonamonadaceae bacterium]|nr:hypothetical protein [Dysgonamonadaceae bacterium]MDD4728002.1 hypothetical protein [Dysgonamonadaceae bacterium]
MKTEDKPSNKKSEKSKEDHVNQNVYDFNPSQFTTEEELEIIKKKKEKAKRKDDES